MHDARPTIQDLHTISAHPGPNNDLIDLTAKQPKLADLTASCSRARSRPSNRAQPVFEYARGYTPDFAAWLSNFGQLAANYDANGHYARVQPMFLPTTFSGGHPHREPAAQKLQASTPAT